MLIRKLVLVLAFYSGSLAAMQLNSQNAIVVDDSSGKVLLEKNAANVVPIASLTKLMTAMVVLDSKASMDEKISIEEGDKDQIKHSTSHVPVGSTLTRREALQLALMSSDNRTAAALARTYPGGNQAFLAAVKAKLQALGMQNTSIKEATGLSPENTSTATDLVKLAQAASRYPAITDITTDSEDSVELKNGRTREFHNTNRLVGRKGWDILLSKTGFTNEAGRCLIMRVKLAGKKATMVLLNAGAGSARWMDALNIGKLLGYKEEARPRIAARHRRRRH
ncbi:serine hydrolase [Undibacterium sp. TS12]|uniref:serine hydrolase n=1 Tax=Undibacterium sp. TS12 TaxID=2908202 RepID=UPI001F4D226D|nr:serine hydrolase [Undibacterium sp. TS12]MCH8620868.1 serine hydrolase [Undibacterium sp. TS12]